MFRWAVIKDFVDVFNNLSAPYLLAEGSLLNFHRNFSTGKSEMWISPWNLSGGKNQITRESLPLCLQRKGCRILTHLENLERCWLVFGSDKSPRCAYLWTLWVRCLSIQNFIDLSFLKGALRGNSWGNGAQERARERALEKGLKRERELKRGLKRKGWRELKKENSREADRRSHAL